MSMGLHDESEKLQGDQDGRIADDLEDAIGDSYQKSKLREATTRRDFAVIAANVTQDRYGAGSNAARLALIIALRHGIEAATNFVRDLEHHEQ